MFKANGKEKIKALMITIEKKRFQKNTTSEIVTTFNFKKILTYSNIHNAKKGSVFIGY